jgi:hypothetical protein
LGHGLESPHQGKLFLSSLIVIYKPFTNFRTNSLILSIKTKIFFKGVHHHHRGAEEPQQTQSEPPPEGQTSKSGSSASPFPLLPLPPPGPGPSQSQLHIQTISRQIMAQIDQRRAASAPNTAAEGGF